MFPRVVGSLQKLNSGLEFLELGDSFTALASGTHSFGLASAKSGDLTSSSSLLEFS